MTCSPSSRSFSGPRSNLDNFRWIVVDHDGQDRHDFLAKCRLAEQQADCCPWHRLRTCFEVWLNAHYAHVKNYRNQA